MDVTNIRIFSLKYIDHMIEQAINTFTTVTDSGHNPVKKSGFTTIGITHKCHIDCSSRSWNKRYTLNGIGNPTIGGGRYSLKLSLWNYLNKASFASAQGNIAIQDPVFHGIL